ncbi:MAG: hypothetical protein PHY31_09865, partial [Smithellaceae bacterium]|nr:hypothetical protein [Smithellaceae bacterium]
TDPTSGLKFGAGTLGLVIDLNRFFKQPDIVSSARFGLGLGLINKYLMRINDTYLSDQDFYRYGHDVQGLVILAGVGFGLLDDMISIGVGGNVLFAGPGNVTLSHVQLTAAQQSPNQSA